MYSQYRVFSLGYERNQFLLSSNGKAVLKYQVIEKQLQSKKRIFQGNLTEIRNGLLVDINKKENEISGRICSLNVMIEVSLAQKTQPYSDAFQLLFTLTPVRLFYYIVLKEDHLNFL